MVDHFVDGEPHIPLQRRSSEAVGSTVVAEALKLGEQIYDAVSPNIPLPHFVIARLPDGVLLYTAFRSTKALIQPNILGGQPSISSNTVISYVGFKHGTLVEAGVDELPVHGEWLKTHCDASQDANPQAFADLLAAMPPDQQTTVLGAVRYIAELFGIPQPGPQNQNYS